MTTSQVETIVFDIGGVLVELGGVNQMLDWCSGALSEAELWRRWLSSPAVRRFEAGRSSTREFAEAVVDEFGLDIAPEQFLRAFVTWPRALYPGTAELLGSLRPRFNLASLSNTNALHWQKVRDELGLGPLLQRHFLSHEIGLMKPDREVFELVVRSLGGDAARLLFFDDNQINVDAARAAGLQAGRVSGVREARAALKTLGLVDGAGE